MTFVTSRLSLGTYNFPSSFVFKDEQSPSALDESKTPFMDGASIPAGTKDKKTIHISGHIGGGGGVDSSGSFITNSDQANAEANLLANVLASGYQQLKDGSTPARYVWVQKKVFTKTPAEGMNRSALLIEIELVAQDPRWLSVAVNAMTVIGGTNIGAAQVSNGAANTYPKFTFTGAYTNPQVTVYPGSATPTGGYIKVQTTVVMAGGDVMVIDCDPRNVANAITLNGVSRLDLLGTTGLTNTVGDASFFPYMMPGSNYISANGSVAGTSLAGSFQDAWHV